MWDYLNVSDLGNIFLGYGWICIKHSFSETLLIKGHHSIHSRERSQVLKGLGWKPSVCSHVLVGGNWEGDEVGENSKGSHFLSSFRILSPLCSYEHIFQTLVVGTKPEGAISTQVCMNSSSRNNQSEQGCAKAHSLCFFMASLPLLSLRSWLLVLRADYQMWMVENNPPTGRGYLGYILC